MATLAVCFAWIDRMLKVQAAAYRVALNDLVAHGEYLKVCFFLAPEKGMTWEDVGIENVNLDGNESWIVRRERRRKDI